MLQPPNTCKMSWDDARVMIVADTFMAAIDKKLKPTYWHHEGSQQSAVGSPQVSPLSLYAGWYTTSGSGTLAKAKMCEPQTCQHSGWVVEKLSLNPTKSMRCSNGP